MGQTTSRYSAVTDNSVVDASGPANARGVALPDAQQTTQTQHQGGHPHPHTNSAPLEHGIRVVCPRCGAHLFPPAPLFRCPCGQMMTFNMQTVPYQQVVREVAPGMLDPNRGPLHVHQQQAALDYRIRTVLRGLPPNDPQAIFLVALLARLPRGADGTIDARTVAEISAALEQALRGAPQALIDMLPTRQFHESQLPKDGVDEEHTSCRVCLSAYEGGETLRTLPCMHSFHKECIDPWLRGRKDCPMCKTPIDVDSAELVMKEMMKESVKQAASAGAGLPIVPGPAGGSAAGLGAVGHIHYPPRFEAPPQSGATGGPAPVPTVLAGPVGDRPLLGLRMGP